jgi:hypothetical protein
MDFKSAEKNLLLKIDNAAIMVVLKVNPLWVDEQKKLIKIWIDNRVFDSRFFTLEFLNSEHTEFRKIYTLEYYRKVKKCGGPKAKVKRI